jgi:hypothetical protein
VCGERVRLLEEFVDVVSEYLMLESLLEAEKRGDIAPHAQIAAAWLRKEEGKRAARNIGLSTGVDVSGIANRGYHIFSALKSSAAPEVMSKRYPVLLP